jgi:VWFA-related protein
MRMTAVAAVLACLIAVCTPDPVGAGGSTAGSQSGPLQKIDEAKQAAERAKPLLPSSSAPAAAGTGTASTTPTSPAPPAAPAPDRPPVNIYARIDQIATSAGQWPVIKLYVSVFDLQGRPIRGLQASDFTVDEAGSPAKPVDVKTFAESQEGMGILLVLDASGSMRGVPFRDAKRGVNSFLSVLGPKDQAALMLVHDEVQIPAPFTGKIDDVKTKVDEADATAKITLLYDGLAKAIDEVTARAATLPDRKVVLVMSDGRDEGSVKKLEDVRDRALAANVPIYGVGFSRIGNQYLPNLKRIAELTGGLYLDARASGQLSEVYARVFEHLKSLYVVTFKASRIRADGQAHPLGVQVVVQGREARVGRRSFDAPLVAATAPAATVVVPSPRPWWPYWAAALVVLTLIGMVALIVWRRRDAVADVTCAACGKVVEPRASACRYCNTKVPPVAPRGRLVVRSPDGRGMEYPLTASINIIGVGEENQVVLKGADIARQHAGISINNKQYELTDYGSEIGTYVNGVRVTQRFLRNKDVVKIGATELVFEMARR